MTSFLDLQKENLSIEVKRSKDLKTFAACFFCQSLPQYYYTLIKIYSDIHRNANALLVNGRTEHQKL